MNVIDPLPIPGSATITPQPNPSLAFSHFQSLLGLIDGFCSVEVSNKTFSQEETAKVLLIKEIDLRDYKNAIVPLKIHLWQLNNFCKELKGNVKAAHCQRYKTLYLDCITDIEEVISAYEFVKNLDKYHRDLTAYKYGRASEEPEMPSRRDVTVHRNPNISSFDRRQVIMSLFWLEHFDAIEHLSFRDIRPHAAILGRQCLELIWKDVIGFRSITDSKGNRLNQFTQIGWKFIKSFKSKAKDSTEAKAKDDSWTISLPLPVNVIDCMNTWCNSFTHDPFINMLHVQWYVIENIKILTLPVNKPNYFTNRHGEIHISGLRPMRADFDEFVLQQNATAYVQWQPENYNEGAFIDSLGEYPSMCQLKKIRLRRILRNIGNIFIAFWSGIADFFKVLFSSSKIVGGKSES